MTTPDELDRIRAEIQTLDRAMRLTHQVRENIAASARNPGRLDRDRLLGKVAGLDRELEKLARQVFDLRAREREITDTNWLAPSLN